MAGDETRAVETEERKKESVRERGVSGASRCIHWPTSSTLPSCSVLKHPLLHVNHFPYLPARSQESAGDSTPIKPVFIGLPRNAKTPNALSHVSRGAGLWASGETDVQLQSAWAGVLGSSH